MTIKGNQHSEELLRPVPGNNFEKKRSTPTYDYLIDVLMGVGFVSNKEKIIIDQLIKTLKQEGLAPSEVIDVLSLVYKMGIMRGSGQLTGDFLEKLYQKAMK